MMSGLRLSRARLGRLALWVFLLSCAGPVSSAFAQSRVRVLEDQTTIWRPGFTIVAEVVRAGTVLDVVARTDAWYEVALPRRGAATGFIAVSTVEALDTDTSDPAERTAPPRPSRQVRASAGQADAPRMAIRGFVQAGYGWLAADQSFKAVFGQSSGGWFGGGAEVRFRNGLFVQASADRFRQHGTRVFVSDGTVYDLGIDETITIVPVLGTLGYRTSVGRDNLFVYAGGGAGRDFYKEYSPIGGEDDQVELWKTSYHALAGLELRGRLASTAVEVQYTRVPDALNGGVSAVYDEHDLGGLQLRVKLLLGR
jgi:hypothetical protein